MKKFIQVVSIALISVAATSQSTFQIIDPDGADVTGGTYNFEGPNSPSDPYFKYEVDFDIHNNSGVSVTSKVKRIETGVLAGTSHYHCFGVCYSAINAGDDYIFPESGDPEFMDNVVIASSGFSVLNTYFKPYTGVGVASFRYVVFNASIPSDSAYVDVVYDIRAFTGIHENEKLKMTLYPNPADHQAVVDFSESSLREGDVTIELCDMLGKKQKAFNVNVSKGQMLIDTEELKEGIYFVSVRNGHEVVKTSRLVVKH